MNEFIATYTQIWHGSLPRILYFADVGVNLNQGCTSFNKGLALVSTYIYIYIYI
jgi:hypothetical protein